MLRFKTFYVLCIVQDGSLILHLLEVDHPFEEREPWRQRDFLFLIACYSKAYGARLLPDPAGPQFTLTRTTLQILVPQVLTMV